jgi:hypothetical protein
MINLGKKDIIGVHVDAVGYDDAVGASSTPPSSGWP